MALAGAVALGALGIPLGGAVATAEGEWLYVNNAAGTNCSDAGTGAQSRPYCTVGAAVAKVQPGQTVKIAPGHYPEQITLTRSGTADKPITIEGSGGITEWQHPTVVGTDGVSSARAAHTVAAANVQHIRIKDLQMEAAEEVVLLDGVTDFGISGTNLYSHGIANNDFVPLIRIGGASKSVTVSSSRNTGGPGTFVMVGPGVEGTVLASNEMNGSSMRRTLVVDGAKDTRIIGNTVSGHCQDAVVLTGAATGTVLANNVLSTAEAENHANPLCADSAKYVGLRVDATATTGTQVSYNAYDDADGSPAYSWAGTTYATVAGFATASGQGGHDAIGTVELSTWRGDSGQLKSPVVDSADETVAGATPTDSWGQKAVDDPWVADTGTGSGRRDRGARELDNFGTKYTAVGPLRVLDTRQSVAVAPGGTVDLPLAGLNGVPTDGVTAVTMNVTVTEPGSGGYLTVYPHGEQRPTASNLNWTAGQTIPNLVTVQVKDGKVSFYNGSGSTTHVIADLLGYYSTQGNAFTAKSPVRLLDTREGQGAAKAPLTNGQPVDLQVTGKNGIPATGVTAVTLNVTVAGAASGGYLTVYPHGDQRPTASNLNWVKGQVIPNLVTVPVKDGKISFVTGSAGPVDVIADLAGYYSPNSAGFYHAIAPRRLVDTRTGWEDSGSGDTMPPAPVKAGQSLGVRTTSGEPDTAVSLNVTVTGTKSSGFLTAYPFGTDRPNASNLNWTAGTTIPNHVVVAVDQWGQNSFFNGSGGDVDVIIDQNGYFSS
ncbi:hypothetical protein F4556_002997 [Kitasatospora gansuensis]|uniref:Right handed beta helix domain-containing protein n=1 Tax=Kitasatospora gansuensis TaxID=258050 RepID=A0A7W7SBY3_9ACTN|nr:hypothetical protein [Kitasatospora gansuensis]MBB4947462.1 hypothetical protein [Kitasatospora gansuensis]